MRPKRLTAALAATTALAGLHAPARAADVPAIGITVASLGNPYFVAAAQGVSDAAKKLTPGAKVIAISSDYDLNKQFTQIDNFIAAGAKIIMINAADADAIAPAIVRAHKAGVVVGAFDVAAKGADITYMTDNVAAGRQSCQYIVDHLPHQKGDVVIVIGPQVSSVADRVNGCKEALAPHPDIHVVSDNLNGQASRDGGFSIAQGFMTRFAHLDAVFAINDPEAIGVALAARQAGRHDFFITSVDGAPDIVPELKRKNPQIRASSAQDPYGMAAKAFAGSLDMLNGKKPEKDVVLLTPRLITTDNVADYHGWARPAQ